MPTDEEIYQMCLKLIKEDATKAFESLKSDPRIVQNKDNVIDLNEYRNKIMEDL